MKAKLRKLVSTALIALSLLHAEGAFGWGHEGHVYVNRVAAEKIPREMPGFLRRAVAEIAYLGPEPDRWRNPSEYALKNAQEPDHFIDLERVTWLDPLPEGRYQFYRALYEKRTTATENADDYLPEHVGLQPYVVMEIYGRLKAAFREYRSLFQEHKPTAPVERIIVFYAGWLGHYVADGSQPLHTTIYYNGWVGLNPNGYTTQHRIHAQFESTYVAQNIAAKDFAKLVHPPEKIADPFSEYVKYLRDSNRLVENVYQLEKAGGLNGKGSAEAFDFTTSRLAAGAQMLLNLWYTAWLDSASDTDAVLGSVSSQEQVEERPLVGRRQPPDPERPLRWFQGNEWLGGGETVGMWAFSLEMNMQKPGPVLLDEVEGIRQLDGKLCRWLPAKIAELVAHI